MPMHEYTPAGLHDFMQRELEYVRRDTPILDVGSGSGAWLERLRRLGFSDLTAVDLNKPEIDVPFIRVDLNSGEWTHSRRFGLVTSFEVYEHVENPVAYLSVIAKAMSPAGTAIITSPNVQALRYRLKFLLRGKMPSFDEKGEPTHITPLFLPRFTSLAQAQGLRIERTWTYPKRGSVMFGRPMRLLSAAIRTVIPDPLPGDSICIALGKE